MRSFKPNQISRRSDMIFKILFMIYSALCLFPMLLVVVVSFSSEKSILSDGYRLIPESFSLLAYRFLLNDAGQILHSYGVSIFVTVVGTVVSLLLTAMYAYPISRSDLPYRNGFAFFVFFTMLFNGGLVPTYLVYVKMLSLQNSIWALIIPLLVQPFFVMIMRTFFITSIPVPVLESAKIDGAGEMRIFLGIVLPLSLPVLATIALFNTLMYWNDWFLSLIYITDNRTISVQFMMYKAMLNIQYLTSNPQASEALSKGGAAIQLPGESLRMAMAVVGIGPIVLAYPFFQRYFVKGLTVGAVKG